MIGSSRKQSFVPWLVLASVVALGASIWTGGDSASSDIGTLAEAAPVLEERDLRFVEAADGTLLVIDTTTERTIRRVPREEEAFMRTLVRAVERDRYARSAPADTPITVSAREDGALLLIDSSTGLLYHLRAFGPTNLAVFAELLKEASASDSDPIALNPGASSEPPAGL